MLKLLSDFKDIQKLVELSGKGNIKRFVSETNEIVNLDKCSWVVCLIIGDKFVPLRDPVDQRRWVTAADWAHYCSNSFTSERAVYQQDGSLEVEEEVLFYDREMLVHLFPRIEVSE